MVRKIELQKTLDETSAALKRRRRGRPLTGDTGRLNSSSCKLLENKPRPAYRKRILLSCPTTTGVK